MIVCRTGWRRWTEACWKKVLWGVRCALAKKSERERLPLDSVQSLNFRFGIQNKIILSWELIKKRIFFISPTIKHCKILTFNVISFKNKIETFICDIFLISFFVCYSNLFSNNVPNYFGSFDNLVKVIWKKLRSAVKVIKVSLFNYSKSICLQCKKFEFLTRTKVNTD